MKICQDCGTETAWPRMSATDDLYDHGMPADRWEFRKVVKDHKARAADGQILDVGCGKGHFLLLAKEAKLPAIGIDFSVENVEAAKARGAECYLLDLRDIEDDRRFAAITAFHVIEHLSRPKAFLETLRDRIEAAGAVYLSFPNVDRGTLRFMRDLGDFPPYHLNRITESGMRRLADRAGLAVTARWVEPHDLHWRYATSLAVNHALDAPHLRQRMAGNRLLNLGLKSLAAVALQPVILWRLWRYRADPGFTVLYKLQLPESAT